MSDTRYNWAHRYLLGNINVWLPWVSCYRSSTIDEMNKRLNQRPHITGLFFCGRSFYSFDAFGGLHEWRQT